MWCVTTENHTGISGKGFTRQEAIDELRKNILASIYTDIENQTTITFRAELIPHTDIKSVMEQIQLSDVAGNIVSIEEIELTPFD